MTGVSTQVWRSRRNSQRAKRRSHYHARYGKGTHSHELCIDFEKKMEVQPDEQYHGLGISTEICVKTQEVLQRQWVAG